MKQLQELEPAQDNVQAEMDSTIQEELESVLEKEIPLDDAEEAASVNLAYHLRYMAETAPYKKAVIYPATRDATGRVAYTHLTFRQLDQESDCLAHGLASIGIRRGTRTILMVKPTIEFFALAFALIKTGAVPVMVDPGMGLTRMLDCLKEGDPEAFIGIPKAHLMRKLFPRFFRSVDIWVTVGNRFFWGGYTISDLRITPWKPYPIPKTKPDEIAAIMFTTGSTGPAKGVVYTHSTFDAQVRHIRSHFNIQPNEIDLPTFPLFAIFDPALGISAVIPDMDPTKPANVDPRKIIEAIINHGITNMFGSPALLNRVGRFGEENGVKLPSLKRVVSAGAPVSPSVIQRFSTMLEDSAELHPAYGATESFPVVAIESREILSETAQLTDQGFGVCIGRPINDIIVQTIKITDEPIIAWSDDLIVPTGEIGEITVKGDLVTQQYYKRPNDDALAKITEDNAIWHRTGDLGWMDKKGRIWFCGRKSHRIITADRTLYTVPCESIFNTHPAVYRSALVGIGPRVNQKPVMCIEMEPKVPFDKNQLKLQLLEIAQTNQMTQTITIFLFHDAFPVDIRHNSKIFREKLAVWASKKVKI